MASAGVVMSPEAAISGTNTVFEIVPEQPEALVTITVIVDVEVILVVVKTRAAPF